MSIVDTLILQLSYSFLIATPNPKISEAHSDRRAEKMAEAAKKYNAFGPNHGGAFRPFDCGRTAGRFTVRANTAPGPPPMTKHTPQNGFSKKDVPTPIRPPNESLF